MPTPRLPQCQPTYVEVFKRFCQCQSSPRANDSATVRHALPHAAIGPRHAPALQLERYMIFGGVNIRGCEARTRASGTACFRRDFSSLSATRCISRRKNGPVKHPTGLYLAYDARHAEFGVPRYCRWSVMRSQRGLHTSRALSKVPEPHLAPETIANTIHSPGIVSLRKDLKDERRKQRQTAKGGGVDSNQSADLPLDDYELTVGIEIHAELNAARKLFSRAPASTQTESNPNDNAALFDLSLPGSQPCFQKATLIPAIRAALALNCQIQRKSTWDRKHYFYHDQPAGYQITQYYSPFAKDGVLTLSLHDGIAPEDGESVEVRIKQVQMEQDTAKTLASPPGGHVLDFNRVSHPLIEIISLPDIHHATTAAAYVKKVQSILKAVDAVTTGMEFGGLRADVNVSVKRRAEDSTSAMKIGTFSYAGVTNLGQRTEIKNLSTFSSVYEAIVAERNRQIRVLEDGGRIEGETRGFSIGDKETRKLRSKEGEVDYRYMPDPDLPPLYVSDKLVAAIRSDMPALPDAILSGLAERRTGGDGVLVEISAGSRDAEWNFGERALTMKDAKTLMSFGEGERVDYFLDVLSHWRSMDMPFSTNGMDNTTTASDRARQAGNWILHELGPLFVKRDAPWADQIVSAASLASILAELGSNGITYGAARTILQLLFDGDRRSVSEIIAAENMRVVEIDDSVYQRVVLQTLKENEGIVTDIKVKGKIGKIMFLLGRVMKEMSGTEGSVQPDKARKILFQELGINDESTGPTAGKKGTGKGGK